MSGSHEATIRWRGIYLGLHWNYSLGEGSIPFKAETGRAMQMRGLVCICIGDVDQPVIRVAMQPPKPD